MKPYYEDDSVTLFHGRCEDILPGLSLTGSVHLLTDPPYFKVKDNDWDNQWTESAQFLEWMGMWLNLASRHLGPDSSIWVFASPEMSRPVEQVISESFRVVNSVRWLKEQGWHNKADAEAARKFLSPWEAIVLAEMDASSPAIASGIGEYMKAERERAGVSRAEMAGHFRSRTGNLTGKVFNMEEGLHFTEEGDYMAFRDALGSGYLRKKWSTFRNEYEAARRVFRVAGAKFNSDVWSFDTVAPYPGKHVCEKPVGLLTHMIETTTRPGDTILDCFAGSGAVLDVARQLGRKAVGIEMDEHWCRQASKRLSQQSFNFEEIA